MTSHNIEIIQDNDLCSSLSIDANPNTKNKFIYIKKKNPSNHLNGNRPSSHQFNNDSANHSLTITNDLVHSDDDSDSVILDMDDDDISISSKNLNRQPGYREYIIKSGNVVSHPNHYTQETLLMHKPKRLPSGSSRITQIFEPPLSKYKTSSPFEYWTIPRNNNEKINDINNLTIRMPKDSRFNLRTKKRKDKNVREKSSILFGSKHSGFNDESNNLNENGVKPKTNDAKELTQDLKVYFRFSSDGQTTFDFTQNFELIQQLQAKCRGWLSRKRFELKNNQNNAILCIQRNSEVYLSSWMRLFRAIKPLIKTHQMEEELMYHKSELERYKSLVRMLRFENAEYQARVANLLHLLDQLNTSGSNNLSVQTLVQQISESLSKNQEFWHELAQENKSLNTLVPSKSLNNLDIDLNALQELSPDDKIKRDAEFYRDQVQLLREDADEQQYRTGEHYRNQVRVLSERVEQLQHILALESSKVERLSFELDESQSYEAEAKAYTRNLEHTVNQLSKQLEQRVHKSNINLSENGDWNATSTEKLDHAVQDNITDVQNELNTYRELTNKLRDYFNNHPEMKSLLENTPLRPGGELDMFNVTTSNLVQSKQQRFMASQPLSPHFFNSSLNLSRDDMNDLTPRTNLTHELIEAKRQVTNLHQQLLQAEELTNYEIENREELENENMNLRDRLALLDRQLRHSQDEYDELAKKEMTQQRNFKELQEQFDDECIKLERLTQTNRELDQQLAELRNSTETDDDMIAKEWESMKMRLKADAMFYKRAFEHLQEEFDQYRTANDLTKMKEQLTDKIEKLTILENEKQHWRMELDIYNVKLQNATSLLDDTELRLKLVNRERTAQMHRVAQLETERDDAIREAATLTGRASADKEMSAAKFRELEEIRSERTTLLKELNELKQSMASTTAETVAERRQLHARLRESETHNEARVTDLKLEIERMREEISNLQVELQSAQAAESEMRSTNQHQKWRISEFEDQVSQYIRRISGLERRSIDLDAELLRAKADLSATRETVVMRRAAQTRLADDWLSSLTVSSPLEDSDEDKHPSFDKSGNDLLSDDSLKQSKKLTRSLLRIAEPTRNAKTRYHSSIPNLSASVHNINLNRKLSKDSVCSPAQANSENSNSEII